MNQEIIVYKKDQRKQTFDSKKLKTSIEKSCLAVGDKENQAQLFAEKVYQQLLAWLENKNEITTEDLRLHVSQFLNQYNPKASQFYQDFKEII